MMNATALVYSKGNKELGMCCEVGVFSGVYEHTKKRWAFGRGSLWWYGMKAPYEQRWLNQDNMLWDHMRWANYQFANEINKIGNGTRLWNNMSHIIGDDFDLADTFWGRRPGRTGTPSTSDRSPASRPWRLPTKPSVASKSKRTSCNSWAGSMAMEHGGPGCQKAMAPGATGCHRERFLVQGSIPFLQLPGTVSDEVHHVHVYLNQFRRHHFMFSVQSNVLFHDNITNTFFRPLEADDAQHYLQGIFRHLLKDSAVVMVPEASLAPLSLQEDATEHLTYRLMKTPCNKILGHCFGHFFSQHPLTPRTQLRLCGDGPIDWSITFFQDRMARGFDGQPASLRHRDRRVGPGFGYHLVHETPRQVAWSGTKEVRDRGTDICIHIYIYNETTSVYRAFKTIHVLVFNVLSKNSHKIHVFFLFHNQV